MTLGVVVGVALPSFFFLDFAQNLLEQRASRELVQQMAKPKADIEAFPHLAPEASCVEAKASPPATARWE
jgi:hypothetical protein